MLCPSTCVCVNVDGWLCCLSWWPLSPLLAAACLSHSPRTLQYVLELHLRSQCIVSRFHSFNTKAVYDPTLDLGLWTHKKQLSRKWAVQGAHSESCHCTAACWHRRGSSVLPQMENKFKGQFLMASSGLFVKTRALNFSWLRRAQNKWTGFYLCLGSMLSEC